MPESAHKFADMPSVTLCKCTLRHPDSAGRMRSGLCTAVDCRCCACLQDSARQAAAGFAQALMHLLQSKLDKIEGKPPGVHKAEAVAPHQPAHRHLSDPMPAKKGGLRCLSGGQHPNPVGPNAG